MLYSVGHWVMGVRLAKATYWSKYSAVASVGVIHQGHITQARTVLAPYLPKENSNGGSAYEKGGSLYALGLIFAGHGESEIPFLLQQLSTASKMGDGHSQQVF